MGERREIGLLLVCRSGSLFGLGMGIMLARFQISGMVFVLTARLNICVVYLIAVGARWRRCRMLMLSGPSELLVLLARMAACVWAGVMLMVRGLSLWTDLVIFLFVFSVLWGCAVVKCLLKAFAMSLFLCKVLLLKLIDMLRCCCLYLPDNVLIVLQRTCVFFLCDQSPEIFSFQMFCLCWMMLLVISWLIVLSWGSVRLVLRVLLRCWMRSLMCWGRM